MEKLCLVLWRERELLDTLLYRLEVEQLVLASNRTAHLMRAAKDVEAVLETLRETEVLRATAADLAAAEIGCATIQSYTPDGSAVGATPVARLFDTAL